MTCCTCRASRDSNSVHVPVSQWQEQKEAEPAASDGSRVMVAFVWPGGSSCHRSPPTSHGSCNGSKSNNNSNSGGYSNSPSNRADSAVAAVKSSSSSCNKHYCSLEIFYDLGTGLSCFYTIQFSSIQSLSCVWLFATPWITARQASLSITNSWSSLRLMSIESVMPSSHLILCRPLLFLPPIPPSIRVFSNESTLRMRWPLILTKSHEAGVNASYSQGDRGSKLKASLGSKCWEAAELGHSKLNAGVLSPLGSFRPSPYLKLSQQAQPPEAGVHFFLVLLRKFFLMLKGGLLPHNPYSWILYLPLQSRPKHIYYLCPVRACRNGRQRYYHNPPFPSTSSFTQHGFLASLYLLALLQAWCLEQD